MTRDIVINRILEIFKEEFDIIDPDLDANLSEIYEFDSIDAIALLEHKEIIEQAGLDQKILYKVT